MLAKKGPLGKIWLAAHMEKKVPKLQIMTTNIPESVENIENPTVPMALRVSGHLLLGVVRIFSRKVTYLLTDCSEAMVKIKDAFRGPGVVELAPGAATRRYDDITNPEHFDEMDLDAELPTQAMAFSSDDMFGGMSVSAAALGDITMPDDVVNHIQAEGAAGAGVLEEQEGFGHNENFAVFFEVRAPIGPPRPRSRERWRPVQPSASVARSRP